MELKKNPNVDPKRNSKLYFQVGLVAVMLLTYVGIELKSADPVIVTESLNLTDNFVEEEEAIVTMPPVQSLPPPPPPAPEVIQVVEDKIILNEKKIETTEVEEKQAVVVAASDVGGDGDDYDIPDELPFAVIEDIPLFPGCEMVAKSKRLDCFNEKMAAHIKKNFNYPQVAAEDGIQGRVSVQFLIDKEGNVTDIKMRGPKGGELLEKEAMRIISKLPKFTPGKQRGKPVRVKYGLPINFKLQ
jgi:periplasmic protein TonB